MARTNQKKLNISLIAISFLVSLNSYAANPSEIFSDIFSAKAGSKYIDQTEGKNIEQYLKPNSCRKHYVWGEPRIKDSLIMENSLYFCNKFFASQYDRKSKTTLWTTEKISKAVYIKKNTDLEVKFQPNPAIPNTMQTYPEEYIGTPYIPVSLASAYNLKQEELKSKDKKNIFSQYFYFTNTTPMVKENLSNTIWADLENQVRKWAIEKNSLYVTTGVIYLNGKNSNIGEFPKSKTMIPTHFYKIISHPNTHGTVSFIIPNKEIVTLRSNKINDIKNAYSCKGGPCSISNFIVPIQEIERLTGIEFYPKLVPYWAVKVKLDINEMFKYEKRELEGNNN